MPTTTSVRCWEREQAIRPHPVISKLEGAVDVDRKRLRRSPPLFLIVGFSVLWAVWYHWDTPSRSTSFIAPLVIALIGLGVWIVAQALAADHVDSCAEREGKGAVATVVITALAAALLPYVGFLVASLVMAVLVLALGGSLKQAIAMLALAWALVVGLYRQLLLVDLPLLPAL